MEQDFLERIRCEYNEKMATCSKRECLLSLVSCFNFLLLFLAEAAKTLAPDQKTTKVTGAKLSVLNVSIA